MLDRFGEYKNRAYEITGKISDFYEKLTGKKPTDLSTFIEREKDKFEI